MKIHWILIFAIMTAATGAAQTVLKIDTGQRHQEIEGFGASDAWCTEVVGATYDLEAKERAAKWLFSTDANSTGALEGIGLTIWRFALGPFNHAPDLTKDYPQDYLDSKGNYCWTVNPGKQWFLDKAISYGCNQIGAWSACILPQLREEGMTEQTYKNYATFLADIMDHYNGLGYEFKYLSPVNEPQYNWTNGEVIWTSQRISAMTSAVCDEFLSRNIETPIFLGEAADWTNLYDTYDTDEHWARNQIFNYFDENSPLYLGDYPNLMKEFGVHSYWTDQNATRLKEFRTKAKSKADEYSIKLHQTEWSMLSDPPVEGLPDNPEDIDYALMLGKVIYSDMVYSGITSWTYWEAFGPGNDARFHLIHTDVLDKSFKVRKNLWMLGNYSRFVRPGYQRIEITGADDLNGLMGTAYISPENDKIVVVLINMGSAIRVNPQINCPQATEIASVKRYVTSSMFDLKEMPVNDAQSIPILAKSATTLTYELTSKAGIIDLGRSEASYENDNGIIRFRKMAQTYALYDMLGCELAYGSNETQVDVRDFKTGVYCLRANCGGQLIREKIYVK